eukprot:CAMPEP_0183702650 /NCGR_PEP_ID=MMETSP0737-20130205/684_1 /TAXON_ID=385413 /ORGANISM="Thalassiosira miniscula, Strain CCMP1093" /LENGTH=618 /DNA_ID=CAMNT_0025929297 /DNA_START=169 /DNA_END=2025 /DNA_ORIENTATION=-
MKASSSSFFISFAAIISHGVYGAYDTIQGRSCFRSLDGMMESMNDLSNNYPDLVSIEDIGDSYLKNNNGRPDGKYDIPLGGYDIYALKVTDSKSARQSNAKGKMLITSGVHARELATPELLGRFVETLVHGHKKDADITWILQHNEIHCILYVNPDGRYMAEKYPNLRWRKNLNPAGGCGDDSYGVDINRNMDFMWAYADGSSRNPCDSDFHGRAAETEPETQALADYARRLFPASQRKKNPESERNKPFGEDITGMYVDIHSSGGYVYYPWGHIDSQSPDDAALQALGRKMNYFNQYKMWAGGQKDFLYPASGDISDWMYAALGVASMGFEIGDDWNQDCRSFDQEVVPKNLPALLYAAKTAQKPFKEIKGPDVMDLNVDNGDGNVRVSALVSDSKMVNAIRDFPDHSTGDQKIAKVELFLDVHPDDYKGSDTKWEMKPARRRLESTHCSSILKKKHCKRQGCKWSNSNNSCSSEDMNSAGGNTLGGGDNEIDCKSFTRRRHCKNAGGGEICNWDRDTRSCSWASNESAATENGTISGGDNGNSNTASGVFNSGEELVELLVDTSSLPPRRHALFVQATDSDGYRGPVSSIFVEVSQKRLRGAKSDRTREDGDDIFD